jgi:hypothetical protein
VTPFFFVPAANWASFQILIDDADAIAIESHDMQRNGNWPVFHKPLISTDYR